MHRLPELQVAETRITKWKTLVHSGTRIHDPSIVHPPPYPLSHNTRYTIDKLKPNHVSLWYWYLSHNTRQSFMSCILYCNHIASVSFCGLTQSFAPPSIDTTNPPYFYRLSGTAFCGYMHMYSIIQWRSLNGILNGLRIYLWKYTNALVVLPVRSLSDLHLPNFEFQIFIGSSILPFIRSMFYVGFRFQNARTY